MKKPGRKTSLKIKEGIVGKKLEALKNACRTFYEPPSYPGNFAFPRRD